MRTKTSTKLFLTALFMSISLFAGAQLRLGVAGGLNMSNITGDNTDDNAMKMGFHVGALVDLGLTDNIILSSGLLYTLKGTQDSEHSDYKQNLTYLQLPINAKIKFGGGLNVFGGPYAALLMSANATDGTTDVDIKDYVEDMDFGINLGVGYDLESGLGFAVQYELGLANISKDIAGVSTDNSNQNTNIGISIRYMFGGE